MNVGETHYISYRKRGSEQAEYFLDIVLAGLPISLISNDFNAVVSASKIKARYPLSFLDCFAVATAKRENAVILAGDPEFDNMHRGIQRLAGVPFRLPTFLILKNFLVKGDDTKIKLMC